MRAIIIDDEKHCRTGLRIMLEKYCEGVSVCGVYESGPEGLAGIEKENPELVFLDIEMPGMNGFEMLQQCPNPSFRIIFTTAYQEYAIQAIRHSALDYLLKPVGIAELEQAVARARQSLNRDSKDKIQNLIQLLGTNQRHGKIALPTLEGLMMVEISQILYCESDNTYTRFFLTDKRTILISKVLKDAETLLEDRGFCRIHNSYVINLQYVHQYIRGNGGEVIMTNGVSIPVSRSRKNEFLSKLERI